jgi:hypothetical protein
VRAWSLLILPGEKREKKEPVKEYMDGVKNVNRKSLGRFISWRTRRNCSSYSQMVQVCIKRASRSVQMTDASARVIYPSRLKRMGRCFWDEFVGLVV